MRIAWVLYGSLEERTGGTIYDAWVVDGLRRAGDEVHLMSLDGDGGGDGGGGGDVDGAMHARRGFERTLPPVARAVGLARSGLTLATQIRELDPDVVVGDELCFCELGIAFRRLGRGAARPVRRVLLVHHLTAWELELSPMRRRLVHAAERFAITGAHALIVTSWSTRERLVREGVRGRIDVVVPGADRLSGSAGGSGSASGVRFLFVGAIVGRKRVRELVRAFGRGAGESATLVIVGSTARDAAYVDSVRREVARMGLGGRVVIEGEVDESRVAEELARADVLVMPSSLEGYGIAATEAIHAGVPVIAARAPALEEALALCPDAARFADDEDALAAMKRFANEPALREAMRSAARAAASSMPTWASCAQRFRAALGT